MKSKGIVTHTSICTQLPRLIKAKFLQRDNRFRVQVQIGKREAAAHLANPGRLKELLIAGRTVWVASAGGTAHRKTAYDLTLIQHPNALVSVNTHLPNRLIGEALRAGRLPGFAPDAEVRSEVNMGESRLDFRLHDRAGNRIWIEVKSVTLVEKGIAAFPDAPTLRGRRHVTELAAAVARGEQASVIFVIQRADATRFVPHDETDPDFGAALRAAARKGVRVRAFSCEVTLDRICLEQEISVSLDAPPP